MGYTNSNFSTDNLWNVEGGPNDTNLADIVIKSSSTSTRLDLIATDSDGQWDVVAFGNFDLSGSPNTVAGLSSATVTSLLVSVNGQAFESIGYAAGFDFIQWLTSYDYRYGILGGDDTFTGSLQQTTWGDKIRASTGNDRFTGYGDGIDANGNLNFDQFYGEGGIDTACYRGKSSEYQISQGAQFWDARFNTQTTGISVKDSIAGRDGTDLLKDVERLQFADTNVALDYQAGGHAGQAYRLYKGVLGREGEPGGLGYVMNRLDQGETLKNVASGYLNSPEFQSKYGNADQPTFINLLYQNILGRAADASGTSFINNWMASGATREDVVLGFTESPEYIAQCITLIGNSGIHYNPVVA